MPHACTRTRPACVRGRPERVRRRPVQVTPPPILRGRSSMTTDSRRVFLRRALMLAGVVACGTNVRADVLKKPPPTLEWLVRYSPIIAVCRVEKVGYVYREVRGGGALFQIDRPREVVDLQIVMEVGVIEWLRAPQGYERRPLRVFGGSIYKADEYRQYEGKELLFFLQRDFRNDGRPGDRADYFSGILSTFMHASDSPVSVDQLPEVRRLLSVFPEARPYGQ